MVFICTTPRRGGLWFRTARLIRAEQAVRSGRLKYQAVKGAGARIDTLLLGAPAVAKQTKSIHSVSLQVQVKAVVCPQGDEAIWILEAMWHASFLPDFHEQNTTRGTRFLLGSSIYMTLSQTDRV